MFHTPLRTRPSVVLAAVGAALLLTSAPLSAEDTPEPVRGCLSIDALACMNNCEREALYRAAAPGCIPTGFVHGRALYCCETARCKLKSKIAHAMWRGKIFDACQPTMINQWRGFRAIRAQVYEGTSWLDGKPSIILDYSCTSRVWADVRDEFREVAPGVWLGIMHRRGCPEPKFETFFALEASCGCTH